MSATPIGEDAFHVVFDRLVASPTVIFILRGKTRRAYADPRAVGEWNMAPAW